MKPNSITIGAASLSETLTFIAEAGRFGQVAARQENGEVVLYIRDTSLKGRFEEWWKNSPEELTKLKANRASGYEIGRAHV